MGPDVREDWEREAQAVKIVRRVIIKGDFDFILAAPDDSVLMVCVTYALKPSTHMRTCP